MGDAASGVGKVRGEPAAFRRIAVSSGNVNDWVAFATSTSPGTALNGFGFGPAALVVLVVLLCGAALVNFREHHGELESAALTDGLTGLGNRRRFMWDLGARLSGRAPAPLIVMLCDLDGFKAYNDLRASRRRRAAGSSRRQAERSLPRERGRLPHGRRRVLCARVGRCRRGSGLVSAIGAALSESGEAFNVTCSYGLVFLPEETGDMSEALQLADKRMYAQKNGGRSSAGRQSANVLLSALREKDPDLDGHLAGVAELAATVGSRLELAPDELAQLLQAAELHDVGKVAVPDSILQKPGPLTAEEWDYMRRHTVIGERILGAAPALSFVARFVRSSHERWDGSGIPIHLRAGKSRSEHASLPFAMRSMQWSRTAPTAPRSPRSKPWPSSAGERTRSSTRIWSSTSARLVGAPRSRVGSGS